MTAERTRVRPSWTWLALATTLAGCGGQTVLWAGRSADRRHQIEVVEEGGIHWVTVDGERRSGYRAIAAWTIELGDDGEHMAYAARLGGGWVVVHDRRHGPRFDGIGEIVLGAGGRLAYAAEQAGRWHVVIDGRPGPAFDAILAGTLRLAGGRSAYVGRAGGGVRVVVDGEPGPVVSGAAQLAIAADGRAVAYVARDRDGTRAIVDGVRGPTFDEIAHLTVAPGGRVAYAGRRGAAWHAVIDGAVGGPVDEIRRVLPAPDGRLAHLARHGAADWLILDGELVASAATIRGETVAFAGGPGRGLVHVATASDGDRLVRDRQAGPRFDQIRDVVVSPDGGRVGYTARRGDAWVVVIDRRMHAGGRWVSAPVFSGDGRRVAFLARRRPPGVLVVVDGRSHRFDLALDGTLAFSRDGRRWSVLAGDLARERLFFAVDGRPRSPLAAREIYSAAARLAMSGPVADAAPAAAILRGWSQAEADRVW